MLTDIVKSQFRTIVNIRQYHEYVFYDNALFKHCLKAAKEVKA